MNRLPFSMLKEVVPESLFRSRGGSINIPGAPSPFVAPLLILEGGTSNESPLEAEVVFVLASAAVGKTTVARSLAASCQAPFLDLARTPVATNSLAGLLSDLQGPGDPEEAFHRGELAIIVDSLDEGRLLSGERSFEGFLETVGELILRDRSVQNRPKVVFFGRPDAVSLASLALQMAGEGISVTRLEINFFDERSSRNLVDLYAKAIASEDSSYHQNPVPASQLVDAYFRAIARALELEAGDLWINKEGLAFAGYAPVLAALGSILARIDNFIQITNRLDEAESREAWEVIETVLLEIMLREQGKFRGPLEANLDVEIPQTAYDQHEQLVFLAWNACGISPRATGRVPLDAGDHARYLKMVAANLSDHPFLRAGQLQNPVLSSLVFAHAIAEDCLPESDSFSDIRSLSRQPFLWRSFSSRVTKDTLVSGRYVGCVLNSFWNDPLAYKGSIKIRSGYDGQLVISIDKKSLQAVGPMELYSQLKNCDLRVDEPLVLVGQVQRGSESQFDIRGPVLIQAEDLTVDASMLILTGDVRIGAEKVSTSQRVTLQPREGARVGWGGPLAELYPWNQLPEQLDFEPPEKNILSGFIQECRMRLAQVPVLILTPGYEVPEDETRMKWVTRGDYSVLFPLVIERMVAHGLAKISGISEVKGPQNKIRVGMECRWGDIEEGVLDLDSCTDARISRFTSDIRDRIEKNLA